MWVWAFASILAGRNIDEGKELHTDCSIVYHWDSLSGRMPSVTGASGKNNNDRTADLGGPSRQLQVSVVCLDVFLAFCHSIILHFTENIKLFKVLNG